MNRTLHIYEIITRDNDVPLARPVRHPKDPDHSSGIRNANIWIHPASLVGKGEGSNNEDWKWDGKRRRFIYRRYNDHLRKNSSGVSPMVAVMMMIAITLLLAAVLNSWALNMSPEIYFHVDEPVTTDVTVEIPDGRVTATYPLIPMGRSATWKDVHIDTDGTITYNGNEYAFLYYEGKWEYPESNYGWLVEERNGKLYLDGDPATQDVILNRLGEEMRESGLLDNEIDFMILRIIDQDMLEMEKSFMTIHYIPQENVDETIILTTSHEFTQVRRHFAFQEHDELVEMQEPEYEEIEDSGYVIHETAVNKL